MYGGGGASFDQCERIYARTERGSGPFRNEKRYYSKIDIFDLDTSRRCMSKGSFRKSSRRCSGCYRDDVMNETVIACVTRIKVYRQVNEKKKTKKIRPPLRKKKKIGNREFFFYITLKHSLKKIIEFLVFLMKSEDGAGKVVCHNSIRAFFVQIMRLRPPCAEMPNTRSALSEMEINIRAPLRLID